MAKLVNALVLGTSNFGFESSSLSIRNHINSYVNKIKFYKMKLPFTLKQLRILKAVASKKNFTKAAEMLFVSQPSLSKQIRILEKQLGILLINRKNNNITLTEGGKIFLQYSERILSLCEESCRTINELKQGFRGKLIIGSNEIIGKYLATRLITIFIKKYPQFTIQLHINSTKTIIEHIVNKKIDVAIINCNILKQQANKLIIKNLLEDRIVLVISKVNKYDKLTIDRSQLIKLNFILLNFKVNLYKQLGKAYLFNQSLTRQYFKFIISLNSINGLERAIDLGFGFSFISSSSKIENPKSLKIIDIRYIKIKRRISILINSKNSNSKIIDLFSNELLSI